MTYYISTRWGNSEQAPSEERLREVISELDEDDPEHPDAWLSHESGWTLTASQDGRMLWENQTDDEATPRHLLNVSPEKILELWLKLSRGEFAAIDAEPWKPGYGSNQ